MAKQRLLKWLSDELEEWPSPAVCLQYVNTRVDRFDRTYYRDCDATPEEAAKRLATILRKVREKFLAKDGARSFDRAEAAFWKDNLMRILSATSINGDPVLWKTAANIFKLPAAVIEKHFIKRKLSYVMSKGDKYEMALGMFELSMCGWV